MFYQAIQTKYIGPSNVRGSRVKAIAEAGSVTLSWDSALNSPDNHRAAAEALARKYGWRGEWFGGGVNAGYVFVCTDSARDAAFVITQSEAQNAPVRASRLAIRSAQTSHA